MLRNKKIRFEKPIKGRETVNTNLSAFSYGASTNKYSTGLTNHMPEILPIPKPDF